MTVQDMRDEDTFGSATRDTISMLCYIPHTVFEYHVHRLLLCLSYFPECFGDVPVVVFQLFFWFGFNCNFSL